MFGISFRPCLRYLSKLILLLFLSLFSGKLIADGRSEYTLVTGDVVQISYPVLQASITREVDLDGNLRVEGVGSVHVSGLTLHETTQAIRDRLRQSDLYIDPEVTISINRYAPVLIAGDVLNPGEIRFFPGLTIGAALSLARGPQFDAGYLLELSRSRLRLFADLETLELELKSDRETLLSIERLMAANASELSSQPDLNTSEIVSVWQAKQRTHSIAMHSLSQETKSVMERQELLTDRILVQKTKSEIASRELADVEALRAKGLQTSVRLATLQRQSADTQSDLLELESASLRNLQTLQRLMSQRDIREAEYREGLITELQRVRERVAEAIKLRKTLRLQLELLDQVHADQSGTQPSRLHFEILSRRLDRPPEEGLNLKTELMPGDTLMIYKDIEPGGQNG